MTRTRRWSRRAALAAVALLWALAPGPARAQNDGVIRGQIINLDGQPWADLTIQAVSDQGAKVETKTDAKGNYVFTGLRHGIYIVNVMIPNQAQPYNAAKVNVTGGNDTVADLNFKDIVSKQNPEYAAAVKKQEEEKKKVETLKTHYDAGVALLEQMKQVKNDLQKAPADQRVTLRQKLADLSNQAATELQIAQKAAGEKDTNQALVWATLGQAYDLADRNEESFNAYQQAVKADEAANQKADITASHYNNLGNALAKAGKVDEAKAAYMKSVELNPQSAATAWRNFGIVLFNSSHYKEAVEPLKKAVELDPKSAQAWYVLGESMVGAMEYKKEGNKVEPIVLPGTAEAFEKVIELDPNGPWGKQAKEGLEQLKAMAPGIQTSIGTKKKKS